MNNHTFLSIVAGFGFAAASATAGEAPAAKNPAPKNPPPLAVESVCDCFNAGTVTVSLYGAGIIFNDIDDDSLGGGLGFGYFFTENVGLEVDATWLATESTLHNFSGSLVLRLPIKSACLAPYVLAGGGFETDSVSQGTWHVGGGIDVRLGGGTHCPGIFADARYTWTEENTDFTLIRAGLKFNL